MSAPRVLSPVDADYPALLAATSLPPTLWVRGTLPRFRYDQLMHFAWTVLFPCALVNLLLTALFVAVF